MKIIIDDFNYKGVHFKQYECEMPGVKNLDEIPEERITEYICESLDKFIEDGNGEP